MQLVNAKKTPKLEDLEEEPVQLNPTEPEDMWHANNLIAIDDVIRAHAIRKVTKTSSTGSTNTERVHTDLTISVTSVFFDPAASSLHVSGRVVTENAFVAAGQYHTLDLELNRPFTLWKKYGWDSVALQTLRDSLNTDRDGAVAAVVMQEGMANVCLITDFQTLLKQRVTISVPKKRSAASDTSGSVKRLYEKTLAALLQQIDFSEPRPLLLAGPGFVAADFRKYIADEGTRLMDKKLRNLAKDAVVTHSSNGHLHSLNEILKKPEVIHLMKNKKSSSESRFVDELHDRLRKDDGRAWYGVKPVQKAVAEGAVGRGGGVLLVNNELFRSQDIMTRKKYVALVDKVKDDGGEARILSSDHDSGRQLQGLGGIACILTYPIYDLDESDDEGEGVLDNLETTII